MKSIQLFTKITILFFLALPLLAQSESMTTDAESTVKEAERKGVEIAPALRGKGSFDPSLSLKLGTLVPLESTEDANFLIGGEFALNCLAMQFPGGSTRSQFSYQYMGTDGLTIQTGELNIHYLYDITDSFAFGGGPGIGVLAASPDGADDEILFAGQLGLEALYRVGMFGIGADVRYQFTEQSDYNLDNVLAAVKTGVFF